ncbi:MAG: hypothetical protein AAF682_10930 [Planctomycetota bacterium]
MKTLQLALLALAPALSACGGRAVVASGAGVPWPVVEETWRTDPVWYDGKAEKAVYAATRIIYGRERSYDATVYTNKQSMDPATSTKASGTAGERIEVFKHHWSERAPTEAYDYDFSTCTFTRVSDLSAFKLTAATQEDCGASFKQVWIEPGTGMRFFESVYFPDAGVREGTLSSGDALPHFLDAMTLVLRDYPFQKPLDPVELSLVPSQKSTRSRPLEPRVYRVTYGGAEEVRVPMGPFDTHRLIVQAGDEDPLELWFSTVNKTPGLNVLVKAEGTDARYELRSHERTAYWKRP